MSTAIDQSAATDLVTTAWREDLVGQLTDYIRIPALSPAFDPEWRDSGHLRAAVDHVFAWVSTQPIEGLTTRIVDDINDRTPLIIAEIPAFGECATDATVLLYGHCDKQPEMTGWDADLGPWKPVEREGKLYGRGGADDGYSAYAALTAIRAVQESGGSHPRCVLLVEASEESGSPDLPVHVERLGGTLGDVRLVVCLDSGCATYDTLWLTSSLRGMVGATLRVDILDEGVHSGNASGYVPSSFRIARQLLDRLEDSRTGRVLLSSAHVEIPDYRIDEAEAMVAAGASEEPFPFVTGASAMATGIDGLLNRTWRPTLSYTGVGGMPPIGSAGNVLRPFTELRLSFRLPPTADSAAVKAELESVLGDDAPYGAEVTVVGAETADGWNAPDLAPWLRDSLDRASRRAWGEPLQLMGEGGTIPFMGMLGAQFPEAQFAVMGVLGPGSNAHGPNEFLHLDYATKLTMALASVLDDAARDLG